MQDSADAILRSVIRKTHAFNASCPTGIVPTLIRPRDQQNLALLPTPQNEKKRIALIPRQNRTVLRKSLVLQLHPRPAKLQSLMIRSLQDKATHNVRHLETPVSHICRLRNSSFETFVTVRENTH